MTQESQPFGVRLDGPTLTRLDAYAERQGRKRGWAAGRAIAAGLDALEGAPVATPPRHPEGAHAGLDVSAIAGALYDLLGPKIADAVADGTRRARRPELAPAGVVGVARVVTSLRDAYEAADHGGPLSDYEARRVLARAVIEAINVLAYGDATEPSPVDTGSSKGRRGRSAR